MTHVLSANCHLLQSLASDAEWHSLYKAIGHIALGVLHFHVFSCQINFRIMKLSDWRICPIMPTCVHIYWYIQKHCNDNIVLGANSWYQVHRKKNPPETIDSRGTKASSGICLVHCILIAQLPEWRKGKKNKNNGTCCGAADKKKIEMNSLTATGYYAIANGRVASAQCIVSSFLCIFLFGSGFCS